MKYTLMELKHVTSQTQFIVTNLENRKSYNFSVKARDLANNLSPLAIKLQDNHTYGGIKL